MSFALAEKPVGCCVEKDSEDVSKSGRKELHDGWFMSVMIQEGKLCSSCHIILVLALWLWGLLNCRAVFCFFVISFLLCCQQIWDSMFPSLGLISTPYTVTSGCFTSCPPPPCPAFYTNLFFLGSTDFNESLENSVFRQRWSGKGASFCSQDHWI